MPVDYYPEIYRQNEKKKNENSREETRIIDLITFITLRHISVCFNFFFIQYLTLNVTVTITFSDPTYIRVFSCFFFSLLKCRKKENDSLMDSRTMTNTYVEDNRGLITCNIITSFKNVRIRIIPPRSIN